MYDYNLLVHDKLTTYLFQYLSPEQHLLKPAVLFCQDPRAKGYFLIFKDLKGVIQITQVGTNIPYAKLNLKLWGLNR